MVLRMLVEKTQIICNFLKLRTPISLEKYKNYKSKLTGIVRCCENDCHTKLIKNQKHDVKITWKLLIDIIRKLASS